MKRFTAILLTLILTVGMSCVAVSADGDVNVYVSIADAAGKLVDTNNSTNDFVPNCAPSLKK